LPLFQLKFILVKNLPTLLPPPQTKNGGGADRGDCILALDAMRERAVNGLLI
jgi:hypothetical protein